MDVCSQRLPSRNSESPQKYLLTVLGFVMLMAMLSPQVLFSPNTTIIGGENSDIWAHLWGNWRTEFSLNTKGELPFQESHLNHPYGGDLYHVDLLNSILGIPLRWVFSPILAQNVLIYIHWLLAAISMMILCRHLQFSWSASVFSALGYAFSPFVLAFPLASGVTERMHLLWLPLFVLCFLQLSNTKQIRWSFGAAGCYLLATIGSWHYGFFLFLMSLPLTIYHLFSKEGVMLKEHIPSLIVPYLSLAFLCGIGTLPFAQMALQSIGENTMIDRKFTVFWDWETRIEMLNDFSFLDLFTFGKKGLVVSQGFDELHETIYIGFVLPILTCVAIFSKRKYAFVFAGCATFFALLALGPEIRLYPDGQSYYSPFLYATATVIPFVLGLEVPWEYILPSLFFLSLCGGIGLEYLDKKWGWKAHIVHVLLLIDWLFLSPAIVPIPNATVNVPEIYREMSVEEGDFAVFDFPSYRPNSQLIPEIYLYYQSIHERPIPYSIQNSWLHSDPFWHRMMGFQLRLPSGKLQNEFDCYIQKCSEIRDDLENKKFRYFILHIDLIVPSLKEEHKLFWRHVFGQPTFQSQTIEVYVIPKGI
jgi:hypothetical protein